MTEAVGLDDLSRHIVECAVRLGQFQGGTLDERIDAVANAARIGAHLFNAADPPKRCRGCGHQPHGGFCPNMASDNECSCAVVTEP